MIVKASIFVFLALLVYVAAQTTDNGSSTTTATSTTSSTSTTTLAPTISAPVNNTCQKHGRYAATNERCTQDYIVCIPNFQGGFWQYRWRCAGTLVFNEKFKKCTSPRKADCLNNSTTTSSTTSSTQSSTESTSTTSTTTAAPSL